MTDTLISLQRKINSAAELHTVVRTMKATAAASISQYETAVSALDNYDKTVKLGLSACFRAQPAWGARRPPDNGAERTIGAVVFGSDQGLVGQFNDAMAQFVVETLQPLPCEKIVWAVGERVQSRLEQTELHTGRPFTLPGSINTISALVSQLLQEIEQQRERGSIYQVFVFHQRPAATPAYLPVVQKLLPMDHLWQQQLTTMKWPSRQLPEVLNHDGTLLAFIREYLFVSLFRACAESLASENASRLEAMQRAEKNIDELFSAMKQQYHQLRQSQIDEELFDLVAGFEALKPAVTPTEAAKKPAAQPVIVADRTSANADQNLDKNYDRSCDEN